MRRTRNEQPAKRSVAGGQPAPARAEEKILAEGRKLTKTQRREALIRKIAEIRTALWQENSRKSTDDARHNTLMAELDVHEEKLQLLNPLRD